MAKAKLFTKIVATCLKQDNAIAVYTDGVVFQPEFYKTVAAMLHEDGLPVLDWVWFGSYHADGHTGIYTYGLRKFGKRGEIEVYADADLNEVRDFLFDIVAYVLECDVVLNDGETIGFSEEQKLQDNCKSGHCFARRYYQDRVSVPKSAAFINQYSYEKVIANSCACHNGCAVCICPRTCAHYLRRTRKKLKKVGTLPEGFTTDGGVQLDLGYKYTVFEIAFVPLWTTDEGKLVGGRH